MTDANGVANAVYDSTNQRLRTVNVAGPAGTVTPETPDLNGAMAGAYDSDSQALRVVMV
jgi:hypothetical protein